LNECFFLNQTKNEVNPLQISSPGQKPKTPEQQRRDAEKLFTLVSERKWLKKVLFIYYYLTAGGNTIK
jgi:hypothetical protein